MSGEEEKLPRFYRGLGKNRVHLRFQRLQLLI